MMKKLSLYTIVFACLALCTLYLYGRSDMVSSTTRATASNTSANNTTRAAASKRSEERRVGKEGRSRGSA